MQPSVVGNPKEATRSIFRTYASFLDPGSRDEISHTSIAKARVASDSSKSKKNIYIFRKNEHIYEKFVSFSREITTEEATSILNQSFPSPRQR